MVKHCRDPALDHSCLFFISNNLKTFFKIHELIRGFEDTRAFDLLGCILSI